MVWKIMVRQAILQVSSWHSLGETEEQLTIVAYRVRNYSASYGRRLDNGIRFIRAIQWRIYVFLAPSYSMKILI